MLVFASISFLLHDRYLNLEVDSTLRDILLIASFTTIGMNASLRVLRAGGVQVVILAAVAGVCAVAQAALASHNRPVPALSAIGADVPARVEALLCPPIAARQAALWAGIAAPAVILAFVAATVQLHHLAVVVAAICPG